MELAGCSQPWFEMQIEYNLKTGCCCYFRLEKDCIDPFTPLNIDGYWNGSKMRNVRKVITSNNAAGTGCEGCQYIRYGSAATFMDIPDSINERQKSNWMKAIENYNNRAEVVDSYPVKYYLNFGLICNLKCIMCCQENMRVNDKRQLPLEILDGIKDYMTMANEIAIIGGEPFLIPNARKFIDMLIRDPDFSDVKLSLFSNGTLIHRYLDKLRSLRRINLCISLDSMGDAYEYIRNGGQWKQVERNILEFRETGRKHGLDWNINIAAVVMKSSIPKLVEFTDWCIGHDLPVHFVPLNPQGFTQDEEIFTHPGLLRQVPNWEDAFDRAIHKLNDKGWAAGAARPLTIMKKELKARELNLEGEDIFSHGDVSQAATLFSQARESDPDYLVSYNNLGVVYWSKGETLTALKFFLKVFEADPGNREAALNSVNALKSLGEMESARKIFRIYQQRHPEDCASVDLW